jgi:Protein of unknown function (DUF3011)
MKRTLLGLVILITLFVPAVFAENIRCESDRGHRHECSFDGFGRVEILRQLSRTSCVEGRTWGIAGRHTVWVSDGCRADFVIRRNRDEDRGDHRDHQERARMIVCESGYNSRHRCEVDTQSGVRLSRQLSRTNCVLNRTWGYDSRGIWVKDGCRAEFLVGR